MGAGPSLQQRVSTFPKRRVTLVPSLCLLKVVAARVVAQLFSHLALDLQVWCTHNLPCLLWLLVSPGIFLSPLRSCVAFARSCALACAARLLSFTSFLPLFSCFRSLKLCTRAVVFTICVCGRSHECHNQNPSYPR